jgi:nitrite reductase/ring-hydroxylating ferredoxin subunit
MLQTFRVLLPFHTGFLLTGVSILVLLAIAISWISSARKRQAGKIDISEKEPGEDPSISKFIEDERAREEGHSLIETEIAVSKEDACHEVTSVLSLNDTFELEKRAIFSKVWLYVSHGSRFSKPGDYHAIELAGFSLFIILGKDLVLRAFHNVCRHRAYPVLRKDCGSSLVLCCRYHGWSYSSKGELIKAPQFEAVEGFNKSQNGLFEIHTTVTDDGFVFINLDGNKHVLAPDFRILDEFASQCNMSKQSIWVMGWAEEVKIDWKVSLNIGSLQREGLIEKLLSLWRAPHGPPSRVLNLFPCTILRQLDSGGWASISLFPVAAGITSVRCDVYDVSRRNGRMTEKDKASAKAGMKSLISNLKNASHSLQDELKRSPVDADTKYLLQPLLDLHRALETEKKSRLDPTARHEMKTSEYDDAAISELVIRVTDPPELTFL